MSCASTWELRDSATEARPVSSFVPQSAPNGSRHIEEEAHARLNHDLGPHDRVLDLPAKRLGEAGGHHSEELHSHRRERIEVALNDVRGKIGANTRGMIRNPLWQGV